MHTPRHRILPLIVVLLIAAILPLKPNQARAQSGIVVENARAEAEFGRSIKFTAKITAASPIQQASLLFRGANEDVTRVETLTVAADGSVEFTYDASLNVFPPFSWVVYWFQATLGDGNTYTSEQYRFQYIDNRFPWREVSQSNVTVHWYGGDDVFGVSALNAATTGLQRMKDVVPISLTEPVHVYIYAVEQDLNDTMLLGGREWAGGHAHADLGVVLVAIPPGAGQVNEMERLIPHELAHVMFYRWLGPNYEKQPAWLIEGIASMMETYTNPDYARVLEIATANNTLIPFEDLCASFPADSGSAYLAYAQSQSFVTYIRDSFGISGLTRLTSAYSDGFECDLGATKALGTSLNQLDMRWRETVLGQNSTSAAFYNLLPFLLLLVIVLLVPIWSIIDVMRRSRKRAA